MIKIETKWSEKTQAVIDRETAKGMNIVDAEKLFGDERNKIVTVLVSDLTGTEKQIAYASSLIKKYTYNKIGTDQNQYKLYEDAINKRYNNNAADIISALK